MTRHHLAVVVNRSSGKLKKFQISNVFKPIAVDFIELHCDFLTLIRLSLCWMTLTRSKLQMAVEPVFTTNTIQSCRIVDHAHHNCSMPTYSANQGDDEDEGAGEVTQDDDKDEVGEGAGEVTRPRGIAWWQLNLYVPPPSCCCPAPPLIIHPGTKSPCCPAPAPSSPSLLLSSTAGAPITIRKVFDPRWRWRWRRRRRGRMRRRRWWRRKSRSRLCSSRPIAIRKVFDPKWRCTSKLQPGPLSIGSLLPLISSDQTRIKLLTIRIRLPPSSDVIVSPPRGGLELSPVSKNLSKIPQRSQVSPLNHGSDPSFPPKCSICPNIPQNVTQSLSKPADTFVNFETAAIIY